MKEYYVYIMASRRNGTLYVGVTSELMKRAHEHASGSVPGFTKDYGVKHLVYFESTTDIATALKREKSLKRWRREWKIALIEKGNPEWQDLRGGV